MTAHQSILVFPPTWLGDAVMATPALTELRAAYPDATITALTTPAAHAALEGVTDDENRPLIDAFIERNKKLTAALRTIDQLRATKPDAALILTNTLKSATLARTSGANTRIGYDRESRGPLLTRKLQAPKTDEGNWACVPAVSYYHHAARALIDPNHPTQLDPPSLDNPYRAQTTLPDHARMRIALTDAHKHSASQRLRTMFHEEHPRYAILNPGGNNPAKRWPPERFAALADHLAEQHNLAVLINGSPAEAGLCRSIAQHARTSPHVLPENSGHNLQTLIGLIANARIVITNDTGPRHIAAALARPLVSLFGPTDPRWTTIPVRALDDGRPSEFILVADPSLPAGEIANDHPERCRIDNITTEQVIASADDLLHATAQDVD